MLKPGVKTRNRGMNQNKSRVHTDKLRAEHRTGAHIRIFQVTNQSWDGAESGPKHKNMAM